MGGDILSSETKISLRRLSPFVNPLISAVHARSSVQDSYKTNSIFYQLTSIQFKLNNPNRPVVVLKIVDDKLFSGD